MEQTEPKSDPEPVDVEEQVRGSAGEREEEADAADDVCTICFEPIASVGGRVALPCNCRLLYCHSCWDQTLAASMSAVGHPRCPSCRSSLRVDYDASTARLVFSKVEESEQGGKEGTEVMPVLNAHNETRHRLTEQAKPRQYELLQQYQALRRSAPDSQALPAPRCVCGGEFLFLPLRARVHRLVEPHNDSGFLVHGNRRFGVSDLIHLGAITCDLCQRGMKDEDTNVWTCENGRKTILHAHSYDVCSQCFDGQADDGRAAAGLSAQAEEVAQQGE
mmetsp:Transcript_43352/g.102063  ORF Transcript_43352/g.102063 Transcript_43352/m.102063 type:complete len:276 (+) Transcript_43352:136-963(+)